MNNLSFRDAMDRVKIFNESIVFSTFEHIQTKKDVKTSDYKAAINTYIEINNKIINYCKSLMYIMRDSHSQRKLEKFIEYIEQQNELYHKVSAIED